MRKLRCDLGVFFEVRGLLRGVLDIGVLGVWKHFDMDWYGRFKRVQQWRCMFLLLLCCRTGLGIWDFRRGSIWS